MKCEWYMGCSHCGKQCGSEYLKYCCLGCEVANSVIAKFDLVKYYEYCKNIYNKMPSKVEIVENHLDYDEFVAKEGDNYRVNLIVEGIHCGSCVWLIENALGKFDEVTSARVNLSTRRLVVKWRGEQSFVNNIVKVIHELGYKPIPYEVDLVELENKKKESELLKSIIISGVATLVIMMLVMGVWMGNIDATLGVSSRELLHLMAGIIAIPAILFSGMPFYRSAYTAILSERTNMDVPISLGIFAATLISIQQTFLSGQYTYYDAALSLIFFLLIGRYFDLRARNKARERAQNVILSQSKSITIEEGGVLKLISINKAKEGDIAFVAVGEKIAADGVVIDGESEVDNSLITGETMPIKIKEGDYVNAGTLNLNSPIRIKIVKVGENTTLSEIIKLIEIAEQGRATFTRFADKVAGYYTPTVLVLSWLTLMCWMYFTGDVQAGIINAIAVLIITCPCALGLAVPVVQVIATSKLMSKGILVKTADALEKLSEIDTVILDKTGTLTLGRPVWINKEDFTDEEVKLLGSLASYSKHPLSRAIANEYKDKILKLEVDELKGQGLESKYRGSAIKIGNKKFCEVSEDSKDDNLELWYLKGRVVKRLVFKDAIKTDARSLIDWMSKHLFKTLMISGDRRFVVARVAAKLGINNFKAEVTPKEKFRHIDELTKAGSKILMIGDGLNDAAALKKAHVSMSPSSAIDVAQTSADIVFQGDKLAPVKIAYNVAQKANKLILQNIGLSLIYNLVTIPAAMLGFINPIFAAIIMSASSLMVVGNSMRLNYND